MTLVRVERSHKGRVATVTLSRPELRNALSLPMLAELTDAFGRPFRLCQGSVIRSVLA